VLEADAFAQHGTTITCSTGDVAEVMQRGGCAGNTVEQCMHQLKLIGQHLLYASDVREHQLHGMLSSLQTNWLTCCAAVTACCPAVTW
jgi:hypothetical protein